MAERLDRTDLVIGPSWKHYKLMLKTTPVFLLVLVGLAVVRDGMSGLILVAVVFAICMAGVALYFRNAQITLTATDIVRRGFIGAKVRSRSDVAVVVRAILPVSALDHRLYYNLFLLDNGGERLLRLKNTHWAEADMNQLAQQLGMPTQDFWNPISVKDFTQHFPKALPVTERRPWVTAFGLVGGIVVAIIVLAVVIVAVNG
jgi:hypothetical protein